MGLPVRRLVLLVMAPLGVVLLLFCVVAGPWLHGRFEMQDRLVHESTAAAIFNTHWTIQGDGPDLVSLPQYERVWILDATGHVLASSRLDEVGHRLESRWWKYLDASKSGTFSRRIPFGDGEMLLSGVHDQERGRWVVLLDNAPSRWAHLLLSGGFVLGLSLIFWTLTGLLVLHMLSRNVSNPLRKLDRRVVQLVRGESLTMAALDRLSRETTPLVGGHAECVVDLARQTMTTRTQAAEAAARFDTLFDALPDWGLIRGSNGTIVSANRALCDEMNVQKAWLAGNPMNVLRDVLPVRLLEEWFSRPGAARIGISRMDMDLPDSNVPGRPITITIQPISLQAQAAWLLLVTRREEDFVENEGMEGGVFAGKAWGMAPVEGEPGKNVRDS